MIGKKRPFSYRNRTDLNVNAKSNHQADGSAPPLVVLLEKGLFFHQQGDLQNAAQHYRQILAVSPLNADALHLLGVLSNQKQDNRAAIEYITRALQIIPDHPIYYNNLGNAFRDGGCCQQAVGCYQKALQIKPDLVEAQINLGIAYHQLADFKQAAAAYQKAILLKPDSAEAHYNLGNTFKAQGLFDEAIFCYQQATALNPMLVEAFYNQATILQQKAHPEEAVACLKRCISARPDWAEAHCNLGNVFMQLDLIDDAIVHYQQAIRIKPTLDEAHNNLGNALKSQGKYDQAVACYRKALHIHPVNAEVHSNLGVTYMEANRMAEATRCFQKATRLNPQFAEAHNFMGLTLAEQGRRNEAIDCFKKAIDIKPNFAEALSHLIHQSQHICDWHALKIHSAKLDALQSQTEEGSAFCAEPPFIGMARHADIDRHLKNAKAWSRKIVQPLHKAQLCDVFESRRQPKQRLNIGYLSGDFHDHATAHLMRGVFGCHDRKKFTVTCYSYGPDDRSFYRNQIVEQSDQFFDIRDLSHVDAARQIQADKIDILVDLKGHTQGARLQILACRPALIQVHYLGYPGTIGAEFTDYLITDKIVTPPEHASFYSEKLVFLPYSYQVNDHQQQIARCKWPKEELGLPLNSFVFSSFNLSYKIDPLMFDCWMHILNQVPRSVLWLLDGDKTATENLKKQAGARGIDPCRLVFAEKLPKHRHLARLRLADLALDTRIVNGHTTTSDSLWAGVPVITLLGDHFASRVSASLLNAIGLTDMIVDHLAAYKRLAVRLASHPAELDEVKARLAQNRLTTPLFDTIGFVAHLEAAYQKMWSLFAQGRAPQQFEIDADGA
jgi:protein O-GlcNAc transferase